MQGRSGVSCFCLVWYVPTGSTDVQEHIHPLQAGYVCANGTYGSVIMRVIMGVWSSDDKDEAGLYSLLAYNESI
jgi:hypothetical protein